MSADGKAQDCLEPSFYPCILVTVVLTYRCHDGSLQLKTPTSRPAPSFGGEEKALAAVAVNRNTTQFKIPANSFKMQSNNIF